MKNIKLIAVAAMIMVTASASAQFTNMRQSGSSSRANSDEWHSFWVEWNPSSISPDFKYLSDISFNAFSLGLSKAFSLTPSAPLFLEVGGGVQYSFKSKFAEEYYDFFDFDDFDDYDVKFSMLSVKVPLSLIYKFDIPNSSVSLMPNAGLDFRFNIFAKMSADGHSVDLFDKDDMDGDTFNRFQIGWHIGLKAKLGQSFLLGASYGKDFSEIAENLHIHTATVSLGYIF